MLYPTLTAVEAADLVQLGTWHRFLPTPGASLPSSNAIKADEAAAVKEWHERMDHEFAILKRICERFQQLGGWTAELSRHIGQTPPPTQS